MDTRRDRHRPPLRQGTDPAEALYREQVRRDVERAHSYLEKVKETTHADSLQAA